MIVLPPPPPPEAPRRCTLGLVFTLIGALCLILFFFNPLDAAIERGRMLGEYRTKAIKAVMESKLADCACLIDVDLVQTDHVCQLCKVNEEVHALNVAIEKQTDFPLPCAGQWASGLCESTRASYLRFVTSETHPIYTPLRLFVYTLLLLSLIGLMLDALRRCHIRVLDPCEIFADLKVPVLVSWEKPPSKPENKNGAATAARLITAGLLAVPPVIASLINVTSETRLHVSADTAALAAATNGLADKLGKTAKAIADPDDVSGNSLSSALKNQKVTIEPKELTLNLGADSKSIILNLQGNASVTGSGENISSMARHLDSIAAAIWVQHGGLYQVGNQIGVLNKELKASNAVLGDTAFALHKTQRSIVRTDTPVLEPAENLRLLCGRLELYRHSMWSARTQEIIAEFLGQSLPKPEDTAAKVVLEDSEKQIETLCCNIDGKYCHATDGLQGKSPDAISRIADVTKMKEQSE